MVNRLARFVVSTLLGLRWTCAAAANNTVVEYTYIGVTIIPIYIYNKEAAVDVRITVDIFSNSNGLVSLTCCYCKLGHHDRNLWRFLGEVYPSHKRYYRNGIPQNNEDEDNAHAQGRNDVSRHGMAYDEIAKVTTEVAGVLVVLTAFEWVQLSTVRSDFLKEHRPHKTFLSSDSETSKV